MVPNVRSELATKLHKTTQRAMTFSALYQAALEE